MDKITASLLDAFTTQNELSKLDEATQFEHFSNFCLVSKLYRGSFELEDVHSGAGGDCGIDGLCLLVNGRMVTDVDQLKDIVQHADCLDADLVFIQTKTSRSFESSKIGSFITGIKDFLSDEPQLVQNDTIKAFKELWEEVIANSQFMINRLPNLKLFYVCTGKWTNDQNLQAVINLGVQEIDSEGVFGDITFEALGAQDIQRYYHDTKNKLQTTVKFSSRITLPDIEGVSEGYLGLMSFPEYLKLIQDESKTIHNIFDDNVRDFQGGNAVNKKIKATLTDRKFELFSVLNNGVTVVASSITPAGDRFTIRDYQVVNGCQTSHVLHDCQELDGIEKVNVPIKIVVTDNEEVKTNITLATNSQTEVKTEQLAALGAFQKELELYYQAEEKTAALPLYYERRSQQYNSNSAIKRTQIISIPNQIKAFASTFLSSPHLVSGYYGTIVNRFKDQIFSESHVYSPYYVSSLCLYRIEQFFRSGELDSSYKKARYHLLLIVRMLVMGVDLPPFNSNKLDRQCEEFKAILSNETQALDLFKRAITVLDNSPLDKDKRQYKAETDTEALIDYLKKLNK
ncbi:AIPR family protein [Vibrio sp. M250220]|uniref:AIPR family protein n=1 Tax=Vibrio sp. M250220 TaxID=3020894 RepID=UPI002F423DB6